MRRQVLTFTALVLTILSASMFIVRAAAYDDQALRDFLPAEGACSTPCWMGIEIGVTRLDDAHTILTTHPWVGEVSYNTVGLSWAWSGEQPAYIDAQQYGLLRIEQNIVRQMRVLTHIRFGDFWLSFQQPNDALLVRPGRFSAFQIADYPALDAQVITSLHCPVQPHRFWTSTSTLGFGDIWSTEAINGRDFNIYHTTGWWKRLRRC